MTTDAKLINDWYRTLKATSACMTCQKEILPYTLGTVEFHHIDRFAKMRHAEQYGVSGVPFTIRIPILV